MTFILFKHEFNNVFSDLSVPQLAAILSCLVYTDHGDEFDGKLRDELNNFKTIVQQSKDSYEEILDKTTKSIEKFIESADIKQEKNIQ